MTPYNAILHYSSTPLLPGPDLDCQLLSLGRFICCAHDNYGLLYECRARAGRYPIARDITREGERK